MRLVCTADLHGSLPEIPECDLLLIAGDICPYHDHSPAYQTRWLRTDFNNWLKRIPAKEIVGIAGNHDFILEKEPWLAHELNWRYLCDTQTTVNGLKIWGTPWSTRFGDWAFMRPEGMLAEKYRNIPRDIDILISHGPPNGYGDGVPRRVYRKGVPSTFMIERTGSTGLANQLYYEVWENLKLILFGHVHEGYGEYTSPKGVKMLNAAHVTGDYDASRNPVVTVKL